MSKRKHKIKKIGGVEQPIEIKNWSTPMKPRIPATKVFKDPKHPSRSDLKKNLKSQIEES